MKKEKKRFELDRLKFKLKVCFLITILIVFFKLCMRFSQDVRTVKIMNLQTDNLFCTGKE